MNLRAEYQARCAAPSDMRDHMPDLYRAALRGGWIVELGVRTGNSTVAFLAGLEAAGDGHLWSFDIAAPDVPACVWECERWTFTRADTRDPATPALVSAAIDVLLLDTDPHTYESTYRELELWGPLVRAGGVILAHDTDDPAMAEPAVALREYQRVTGRLEVKFKRGCHGLGVALVT